MLHFRRQKESSRFARIAAWIAISMALASCATVDTLQKPEELAGTHGYVMVTLPVGFVGAHLRLKSRASGIATSLDARGEAHYHRFGRWLPPGEYELSEWEGIKAGGYPIIRIEAGRLTDLGEFIKVPVGGYDFVVLPLSNADTRERSKEVASELGGYLRSKEPLAWQIDKTPGLLRSDSPPTGLGLVADLIQVYVRSVNEPSNNQLLRAEAKPDEFLRLAKASSAPITEEPVVVQGQDMLYGASLGSIRVRQSNGKWRHIDTGTQADIWSVAASGAARYAGTNLSTIRESLDGGVTWKEIAAFGAGMVMDIDRIGNDWYVVVAKLTWNRAPALDKVTVYHAAGERPVGLKPIKEIQAGDSVYNWRRVRGQTDGRYYFLSTGEGIHRRDLATGVWTALNPPSAVTMAFASPLTKVLTAYKYQGVFSRLFVSPDAGETWRQLDAPPGIDDIVFTSLDHGLSTRWNPGMITVALERMRYEPGKGWSTEVQAPQGCAKLLRDERLVPTYCVTTGGSILKDSAGKWTVEFALE